jgi:hypothetical protein
MPPQQYVAGLAHPFAYALIAGILLAMAAGSLRGYGSRVLFVLLAGLLASVWIAWGDAIWWFHPWTYVLGCTVYHLVSALLMGLVLAALIKPAR